MAITPFKAATLTTNAASYNRYMYGLGVFHARTRANLTTADLAQKLALSPHQAELMMGEMLHKGVITPTAKNGVMQAVSQHMKSKSSLNLQSLQEKLTPLKNKTLTPNTPKPAPNSDEKTHDKIENFSKETPVIEEDALAEE